MKNMTTSLTIKRSNMLEFHTQNYLIHEWTFTLLKYKIYTQFHNKRNRCRKTTHLAITHIYNYFFHQTIKGIVAAKTTHLDIAHIYYYFFHQTIE